MVMRGLKRCFPPFRFVSDEAIMGRQCSSSARPTLAKLRAARLAREWYRRDGSPEQRELTWAELAQRGFVRGPLYALVRFVAGGKDPRHKSDSFFDGVRNRPVVGRTQEEQGA